ncbi:DUF1919 domain-containing protein [Methanobrevibacter sp.]|uniref:DUF1919 domain-containing protein n=1 Tax=Methanobrevibacter sp. TaxID=66852 RepID=UPI00388E02F9
MASVVLIGNLTDYRKYFNLLERELKKENIKIVGALFDNDLRYNVLDGFDIYESLDDVENVEFDYFILLRRYKSIRSELRKMGFKQKVISIRVFRLPNFDFLKYEKLIKNPPSIISRHCWGGLLYHHLGMKFYSPFINLFLLDSDFNKLAKDFSYYIKQELVFDREEYEHNLKRNYPVAKLDDIYIHFNHYNNFEVAKKRWDTRKKRIRYENLFFETTTENAKIAREFDSLPLEHKLCFYWGKSKSPNIIDFSAFMKPSEKGSLGMVVNNTANGKIPYFNPIDLLLNYNYKSRIEHKK